MNFFISSIFKIIALLFCLLSLPIIAQTTDSSSQYTIRSIKLIGNKKTKDKIILRELVKKEGDTLTLKYHPHIKLRSEYNIFNTQLFIFDSILSTVNDSSRTIDYIIKLKERWYIWPIPFVDYLDRNINSWWQTKETSRLAVGMQINFENFSGVKDWLLIQFRVGYANQFVINYRLPYLNKKQTLGTYVQYAYNEFNKISYATYSNKQQFVTNENEHVRTDNSVRVGMFYRPRLFQYHSFDVGAYQINVSPFLRSYNPDYLLNQSNKLSFINLAYRASFDNRDNKIYPLKGTVLDLIISKDGLNLSEQSPLNYAATLFTYKQFLPIHKKLNFATLWRTRLVNVDKKVPYIYNQALGYSNFIRGYEYNVIDGQNYFLTKNSFRFQLIKPKFHEINVLKKENPFSTIPFYAYINLFIDAGYVQEKFYTENNALNNTFQYGYGAGIDFITYYDFVMRLEYSFNKMKQSGFFIHFASGF